MHRLIQPVIESTFFLWECSCGISTIHLAAIVFRSHYNCHHGNDNRVQNRHYVRYAHQHRQQTINDISSSVSGV
jgi:hypothetical protein